MFAYLFFFRTTNHFGIPLPSGHTNMIQMILTLKVSPDVWTSGSISDR